MIILKKESMNSGYLSSNWGVDWMKEWILVYVIY